MKAIIITLLAILFSVNPGFKKKQLEFKRVKDAFDLKQEELQNLCSKKGIDWQTYQLFLRALKKERRLEIWARNKSNKSFKKLIDYPFCAFSGRLGPKRRQGDYQIPEGVYHIDRFNPWSNFHLSLGLNYPNKADKLNSTSPRGGDIFIHGDCLTIGCIPITDDKIKELYVLSVQAKENGQNEIPIHIFPFDFSEHSIDNMVKQSDSKQHCEFWKNLSLVFSDFENEKKLSSIEVNSKGEYMIK